MYLNDLKIDDKAIIKKVEASKEIKKRLFDLGFIKNSLVKKVLENRGMVVYDVLDSLIAIRKNDTKNIEVEKCM